MSIVVVVVVGPIDLLLCKAALIMSAEIVTRAVWCSGLEISTTGLIRSTMINARKKSEMENFVTYGIIMIR